MADKTIVELEEIVIADGSSSFLVIDDGTQTYKIKPVNIPGLPRSNVELLTITSTAGGFSADDSYGVAYADKAGQWKLDFNIAFTKSTTTQGGVIKIEGVEFGGDPYQALALATISPTTSTAYAVSGTNDIEWEIASSTAVAVWIQGSVLLAGEPDWYDGAGSGGDGFDPEPGSVDSVNGQIGNVLLTTSEISEGSRLYFTESRARNAVVDGNITSGVTTKAASQDALFMALAAKQSVSQKNTPNGYPGLDAAGKILVSQLPSAILGSLIYRGALNASLGSYPASPSAGDYWVIDVAGTISGVVYAVKDWAVYNGSSWDKVSGSAVSVTSVNGQDGVIVLNTDNIPEGTTNTYFTNARARGAVVIDSINDGETTTAPSQNAVFDALATLTSAKQSVSEKAQPNGYPSLDSSGKVPSAQLPDIAGGLSPVGVIATGTSVNNTIEEVTLPGATIVRTVPALPLVGEEALSIVYIDKPGTASTVQKITIAPALGKKFERPGFVADQTISIDFAGGWLAVTAAPGATSYTIQTPVSTIPNDASDTVPGIVTIAAQTFGGIKTFKNGLQHGNASSSGTGYTAGSRIGTWYEEGTWTSTFSFIDTVGVSMTFKLVRINSVVTLRLVSEMSQSTKSSTSSPAADNVIPANFRPASNVVIPWGVRNNSVWETGNIEITSTGVISFYRSVRTSTAWTSGAAMALAASSVSYPIT